jgi:hypothetical protein
VSSLRGIKRMEFALSGRKKAFVRCCRDGVPHREGCGIEINARTGIIYEHVIPAGLAIPGGAARTRGGAGRVPEGVARVTRARLI